MDRSSAPSGDAHAPRAGAKERNASLTRPAEMLLHVGHGKTGTSFLQSLLANSIDVLNANGIAYPIKASTAAAARAGRITSGNLAPGPGQFSALLREGWTGPTERLLLSSESYFFKMKPNGFMERIRFLLPDARLKVLLYIRDPLEHAASHYQQMVKRAGFVDDFETFLDQYNIPRRVQSFADWLEELGVETTVRNYSRISGNLQGSLEEWLGLPADSLKPLQGGMVNRSMTRAELALQMAFNRHFGASSARFVSDPLCDELPGIRSERPAISRAALERFLERMAGVLEGIELGDRLAPGEGYRLASIEEALAQFEEPADDEVYGFTAAQLDMLARTISERIPREDEAAKAQEREERLARREERRNRVEAQSRRAAAHRGR